MPCPTVGSLKRLLLPLLPPPTCWPCVNHTVNAFHTLLMTLCFSATPLNTGVMMLLYLVPKKVFRCVAGVTPCPVVSHGNPFWNDTMSAPMPHQHSGVRSKKPLHTCPSPIAFIMSVPSFQRIVSGMPKVN